MVEQDLVRLARDFVEIFNAGDFQRYKTLLTPDCVYHELATQRRIQGVDKIIESDQEWKQAFPDAKGTVTSTCASSSTVTLEITWEGTQTGPLMGPGGAIPASGKRAVVPACMVLTFQGDKLKECHHYFDMMTLLQQVRGSTPGWSCIPVIAGRGNTLLD